MSSLYDTVDFSSDDYDRVGIQRPKPQGNQNQQKPVVTKNICVRIKQHRFSILAFVSGIIITIVITVPVMLTKSSTIEDDGFNIGGDYTESSSDDYVIDNFTVQREQVGTFNGTSSPDRYVDGNQQGTQVAIQINTSEVGENRDHVTARDTLIRLKQHKWSILAFVCGVILTLVIVLPVMLLTSSSPEKGSLYNFTLKFDRKSTHSSVYLSPDNTILSNVYTIGTPDAVNHSEQLLSYMGTIGDRCFTSTDKIYFEIKYTFIIHSDMPDKQALVAEVGLVSKNNADNYFYVAGSDGWSFNIHNCFSSVLCITAQHNKQRIMETIKIVSRSNTANTSVAGSLGFFVNMKRQEFSIIDKDTMQILHTFEGVSSPEDICPAFAVYNPKVVKVMLKISYAYDFKDLPVFNVVA
ncbi:unnamed protein product [Mytilus edulis]|uniref:B30.2/SPRY domain-containing protein n=1 Tax=Mytilus edulis TaxID=6550 RepID=A0A8S3RIF7_MYTED|nr:unnamed protein product [Mytilus edulis]